MKIPGLVVIFFLSIPALFCQERNSVHIYKKLLSIHPGAHQVEFLNNLAIDSSSKNPSIALFYAKLAGERARVFSDDTGLAKSYYNLGIIKRMNLQNNDSNKTNETINDFQSSIDIFTTILNKKGTKIEQKEKKRMIHRMAFARCGIGQIYSNTGKNYSEAILQLRAGLKSCESVGDSSGMALLFHTLGIVYYLVGIFPESLNNLLSALKILEKIGDKAGAADVSIQLGIVYRKLDLLTEALNNYNKSLSIFSKLGNNIEIAVLLNNIGTIKYQQGKLYDALIYYHAAQELHSKLGEKNYLSSAFSNIGLVYRELGNYKEALSYLEKS
ncbi:MAG: tetratricopeptide repeat protein, partial [Bacteroidota bacterium]